MEKNIEKIIEKFSDLSINQFEFYENDINTIQNKKLFYNNLLGLIKIGKMVYDLDYELFLLYLKVLHKENIHFSLYEDSPAVIRNWRFGTSVSLDIYVPVIRNPYDLFCASHEFGHAIENEAILFKDVKPENLYLRETISTLFTNIAMKRYSNINGEDEYVDLMKRVIINNANNCIESIKENELNFEEKQMNASYPIGVALSNYYFECSNYERIKFLKLMKDNIFDHSVRKELIDIDINSEFFIKNYESYIKKMNM